MTAIQGAHLVGSINFETAEETFRTAAEHLGDHLKRIPDGEVGERFHWILFQGDRLGQADGIERVGDHPIPLRMLDLRPVRLAAGVQASDLELPPLGYAEAAISSYEIFAQQQAAGIIPAATRFQVSLPTPLAVIASKVVPENREEFEPVYEAALARELDEILTAIPHDKLAIQWDAALEFAILEGQSPQNGQPFEWFTDVWSGTSSRVARQIDRVPLDVEVGLHLCYGDVAEKHFVEPADTANLARFTALVTDQTERPLTWLHLPVPIERDDAEYFEALGDLAIPLETELYLGLMHREDGEEGARRRITAARMHVVRPFGVATECGFGRSPEGTAAPLFAAHREVAAAW